MKPNAREGNGRLHVGPARWLTPWLLVLLGWLMSASPAAAGLQFTPSSLDFGRQQVGSTSDARSIAVTNSGISPTAVRLSTPALGGPNKDEFEFVPSTEAGACMGDQYLFLLPAAGCQVAVRFRPRSAGAKKASLRFDSSDADTAQEVGLTGTGVDQARSPRLERISISADGIQGNEFSLWPSISADGRYVAFASYANNLVHGDTNGATDTFVRDRVASMTERASVFYGGSQISAASISPAISAAGRYVAFDIYGDFLIRDRVGGTTESVSVAFSGGPGNNISGSPTISADGRYVAFWSSSDNLVPEDTNGIPDIFVWDRLSRTTERVSISSSGTQADSYCSSPAISADGRYVAFASDADNLVTGDTNGARDLFVHDRMARTTERVSISTSGTQGNMTSDFPSISADGRYVAFLSLSNNLVPGDTNDRPDIFVRDRVAGTTERVSVSSSGTQGDQHPPDGVFDSQYPSISADGRYVTFTSNADSLIPGEPNGNTSVFVRDRVAGTTELVGFSFTTPRLPDGALLPDDGFRPVISADGRYIAFASLGEGLVPGDTNSVADVFVWDRLGGGP